MKSKKSFHSKKNNSHQLIVPNKPNFYAMLDEMSYIHSIFRHVEILESFVLNYNFHRVLFVYELDLEEELDHLNSHSLFDLVAFVYAVDLHFELVEHELGLVAVNLAVVVVVVDHKLHSFFIYYIFRCFLKFSLRFKNRFFLYFSLLHN